MIQRSTPASAIGGVTLAIGTIALLAGAMAASEPGQSSGYILLGGTLAIVSGVATLAVGYERR